MNASTKSLLWWSETPRILTTHLRVDQFGIYFDKLFCILVSIANSLNKILRCLHRQSQKLDSKQITQFITKIFDVIKLVNRIMLSANFHNHLIINLFSIVMQYAYSQDIFFKVIFMLFISNIKQFLSFYQWVLYSYLEVSEFHFWRIASINKTKMLTNSIQSSECPKNILQSNHYFKKYIKLKSANLMFYADNLDWCSTFSISLN